MSQLHAFLSEAVFPARWDRVGTAGPIAETLGLFGIAVMAFTLGLGNTGQSIGMGFLIAATLLAWRTLWQGLRTDWVARLAVLWFCYVLLRTLWAIWEMPMLASEHLDQMRSVARVLLFPLACWWLGGTRRSVLSMSSLVLAGTIFGIVYYGSWNKAHLLTPLQRYMFGGDPRLEGLLYVSILAGMIAFARAWWGSFANRAIFFLRALLWVFTYLLVLWALIAVQARAAWIAGTIVGLVFVVRFIGGALRGRAGGSTRRELVIALSILAGTIVMLAAFADQISDRFLDGNGALELALRGEAGKIEDRSLATRVYMIGVGWEAWLDRPLFGWGPGISEYLISHADIPKAFQQSYWELHNNYLEMLVRFGAVGALLFFGLWIWLIARFVTRLRLDTIPVDMGGFVLSVSLVFFIVNLTDTYIGFQFGWFYMMFLCALLHSPLMRPTSQSDVATPQSFYQQPRA